MRPSSGPIRSAPTSGWRPMFTGIVEELGAVRALAAGRLAVACPLVATDSPLGARGAVGGGRLVVARPRVAPDGAVGASVAVTGTCLTVVEHTDETLAFDLSG